jgi:hypothetical protein
VASGRDALVVLVQATDLVDLNDDSSIDSMDLTALRAVHLERQMSSPPVVVVEVVCEDAVGTENLICALNDMIWAGEMPFSAASEAANQYRRGFE